MPSQKLPDNDSAIKPPLINCHTHIFTSDYVPKYLAKTFVPAGLYHLLNVNGLVRLVSWWYTNKNSPHKWPYQRWHIRLRQQLYKIKVALARYAILRLLKLAAGIVLFVFIFYELYRLLLRDWMLSKNLSTRITDQLSGWLEKDPLSLQDTGWWIKGALLIILLVFFPSGRNLLFFVLKKLSGLLGMLPGKHTTELIKRYMNIIRFARYQDQFRILSRLISQYPDGSSMIVLPMDMEFMEAGKPLKSYEQQMQELKKIKDRHPQKIHPFLFVDPRRKTVGNLPFFEYSVADKQVVLEPCFIKTYMEEHKFAGFKIYPALGYYPFDETLLPLWKYAADKGIPIMTHCIKGTIFYRGRKKKEWDQHPVFEQYEGNEKDKPLVDDWFKPLFFAQINAVDVQDIFTHPLNYACLLKKEWLAKLVAQSKDPRIHQLFGYDAVKGTIDSDLSHLKICFAHFGGDEEWTRFLEKDRDNWAHQLNARPDWGIELLYDSQGKIIRNKGEQLWKYADWYSLICSLMLQHKNVYADISYILHNDAALLPLLKQTLQNEGLRKKVLYGTDFYVVRNHKSDKQMLADMTGGLSTEEFDQIARYNPIEYLKQTF